MRKVFSNRKILYFLLCIVLVFVFTLTVVYAALNTVLNITGIAEVSSASWDIYLDNVQLMGGSATDSVPTIVDKSTVNFSTTLSKPGDFYIFTVDVVNNGSIDAMIDGISKTPTLTEVQAKYLNYIVEYQNGESINAKQLVEADSFVRLKVILEYRKDINSSDLPATTETLNLSFSLKYIQAEEDDGTSNILNNGKLVKVVSGDYDTVGSQICIKDECFYVISSTDDNVTMLAKYNLYDGGWYENRTWTAYGVDATGKQDSNMIGYPTDGSYPRRGTTAFSSDNIKGTNYSDYSGSLIEGYVDKYHIYLESLGVDIQDVRIINEEEIISLGCSKSTYSCKDAPTWVYSSSYWTGVVYDVDHMWCVISDNVFGVSGYTNKDYYGIRPVVVISKSEF